MNKPLTQNEMTAVRALADRVSLITGSASGISLGIARALAAAGSAVLLNGFGNPDEFSATNRHSVDGGWTAH
jgi:3-hydroxybutyrate dehydrogenase